MFEIFMSFAMKSFFSCLILTFPFGFDEDFENNRFNADFILCKFESLHTFSASLRSLSVIFAPSYDLKVKTA